MNPTLAQDARLSPRNAWRGLAAFSLALTTIGVAGQTAAPAAKTRPPAKAAAASPVKKGPAAAPPLPAAPGEQMAAASMAHFGTYHCDFSQTVDVALNPKHEGYIDVRFGRQAWIMRPVMSSTGALRLEDVKGRMLMLQIANKSMLMDTQVGRRLVDECLHEKQREFVKAAEATAKAAPGASAPQ